MRKVTSCGAGPVMVIAPLHRSGTTYLHDILALHPDLESHAVNEDYLLSAAHHLEAFSAAVHHNWARRESNRQILDSFVEGLMPAFGSALSQLLGETSTGTRVLLKTPVVSNLHLLPLLFSDARTVAIVRDGREVVASAMKSFGWKFEASAHRWARNVRTLLAQCDQASQDILMVRYEDIIEPKQGQICTILDHLGLDTRDFPFDAITEMPVRGASSQGRNENRLNWSGVKRHPNFQATKRSTGWSRAMQTRFQWIAGSELERLGYATGVILSPAEQRANRAIDIAKNASRPLRKQIARRFNRKPSP